MFTLRLIKKNFVSIVICFLSKTYDVWLEIYKLRSYIFLKNLWTGYYFINVNTSMQ